jgi:hypothetical protein
MFSTTTLFLEIFVVVNYTVGGYIDFVDLEVLQPTLTLVLEHRQFI